MRCSFSQVSLITYHLVFMVPDICRSSIRSEQGLIGHVLWFLHEGVCGGGSVYMNVNQEC